MPPVTEVLRLDLRHPDPAGIARAAAILRAGGLVAFPTETVYGLGAHALDAAAVRRVFDAKGRPAEDPLIVHVHDVGAIGDLVDAIPAALSGLASRFWPGPLTMVLRRSMAVPTRGHSRTRDGCHSRPGTPDRPRAHRSRGHSDRRTERQPLLAAKPDPGRTCPAGP